MAGLVFLHSRHSLHSVHGSCDADITAGLRHAVRNKHSHNTSRSKRLFFRFKDLLYFCLGIGRHCVLRSWRWISADLWRPWPLPDLWPLFKKWFHDQGETEYSDLSHQRLIRGVWLLMLTPLWCQRWRTAWGHFRYLRSMGGFPWGPVYFSKVNCLLYTSGCIKLFYFFLTH